jgi:hypothetical protein
MDQRNPDRYDRTQPAAMRKVGSPAWDTSPREFLPLAAKQSENGSVVAG